MTADLPSTARKDGSLTTPARGYSWPPFPPGHTLSLKHGVRSERMIAERAEQVHAELLRFAPWVAEDRYLPSIDRYLKATAREQLAHEAIVKAADQGDRLSPRMVEAATAASRLAWQMADQLGLTPAGHAKLKMLVAGSEHAEASLADLAASGREVRLAAEARRASAADVAVEPPVRPAAPLDGPAVADDTSGVCDGQEGAP